MKGKWRAKKKGAVWHGNKNPIFSLIMFTQKIKNGCVKCGDAVVGAKYLPLHCLTKWEKRFVGFSIFRPV